MNVEAQAIDVPTGAQDYRPAYYGGISAVELGVNGVRRVAIDVAPERAAAAASRSPTPTRRATRASTTGTSPSATSTATPSVQRSFARIRDIAAAMRTALERRDWSEVGRQIAAEWENRKTAGARRDDARDRRDARRGARRPARSAARSAAPAAAAACSASATRPTSPPSARPCTNPAPASSISPSRRAAW